VYNFLERVYSYEFHVPLGFELKAGKFWGDSSVKGIKGKAFPEDRENLIWS
jgi:hypothetical protein